MAIFSVRDERTRRAFAAAMSAGVLALLSDGCNARGPKRVAVLPKTTSIDYWENLRAGAQLSATQKGIQIIWNAPQSETNFAEQALMLEDYIKRKVDGIVLAPSHGSVLASAVQHAKAEGIPLVVVDSPVMVDESEYEAYIGSDPDEMGKLAAARMGTILKGTGEVVVIGVSPTVEAAVRREDAFAKHIAAQFPGIHIVGVRYGLSDAVRSREVVSETLGQNSRISAFFASDSFAVRGTLIALRNRLEDRPKLIGVAQEVELMTYIERGQIDSLVVQDSFSMGREAITILERAFAGGYNGPRRLQTHVALATKDNLQTAEIRDLSARRVT